jgi:hypothetical protein
MLLLAPLLLLTACARQSESNGIDTVLKSVSVPDRQTSRSIVYGSLENENCHAISERVGEILQASDIKSPMNGLLSRDVQGRFSRYTVYFVPSQLVDVNHAAVCILLGRERGISARAM